MVRTADAWPRTRAWAGVVLRCMLATAVLAPVAAGAAARGRKAERTDKLEPAGTREDYTCTFNSSKCTTEECSCPDYAEKKTQKGSSGSTCWNCANTTTTETTTTATNTTTTVATTVAAATTAFMSLEELEKALEKVQEKQEQTSKLWQQECVPDQDASIVCPTLKTELFDFNEEINSLKPRVEAASKERKAGTIAELAKAVEAAQGMVAVYQDECEDNTCGADCKFYQASGAGSRCSAYKGLLGDAVAEVGAVSKKLADAKALAASLPQLEQTAQTYSDEMSNYADMCKTFGCGEGCKTETTNAICNENKKLYVAVSAKYLAITERVAQAEAVGIDTATSAPGANPGATTTGTAAPTESSEEKKDELPIIPIAAAGGAVLLLLGCLCLVVCKKKGSGNDNNNNNNTGGGYTARNSMRPTTNYANNASFRAPAAADYSGYDAPGGDPYEDADGGEGLYAEDAYGTTGQEEMYLQPQASFF